MTKQQENGGWVVGLIGFFLFIGCMGLFSDDSEPQDATDPAWIEKRTENIPVWKEQEAAATLVAYALARDYDILSTKDRELLMKEVADEYDMTVNQLKACYNKHK